MVKLWVSAHRLTEVNSSLKLNKNLSKGSGDTEKYEDTCGQTDGRMDRRMALLIPLSLRGGDLKI